MLAQSLRQREVVVVMHRERSPLVYVQRFSERAGLPHIAVRSVVFFVVLLIVVGLAGWLYLHQASEVAAGLQRIRRLQNANDTLQQEILSLRSQVALLGSLKHVQELGVRRGYVSPESSGPSGYLLLPYSAGDVGGAPAASTGPETQDAPLPSAVRDPRGLGQRLMEQLRTWMGSPAR